MRVVTLRRVHIPDKGLQTWMTIWNGILFDLYTDNWEVARFSCIICLGESLKWNDIFTLPCRLEHDLHCPAGLNCYPSLLEPEQARTCLPSMEVAGELILNNSWDDFDILKSKCLEYDASISLPILIFRSSSKGQEACMVYFVPNCDFVSKLGLYYCILNFLRFEDCHKIKDLMSSFNKYMSKNIRK